MSLHVERGPMVVDDLRALPAAPLIVAEGSVLPASAISAGVAVHAIWLAPSTSFQQLHLERRGTPRGQAQLQRMLRDVIAREAVEHGAPAVAVDASTSVEDVVERVEQRFRMVIEAGPRAVSAAQRRELLSDVNDAIARQVRGFYAQPWAAGDADSAPCEFVCECPDPDCGAVVRMPVGMLAARRPLRGHDA